MNRHYRTRCTTAELQCISIYPHILYHTPSIEYVLCVSSLFVYRYPCVWTVCQLLVNVHSNKPCCVYVSAIVAGAVVVAVAVIVATEMHYNAMQCNVCQ